MVVLGILKVQVMTVHFCCGSMHGAVFTRILPSMVNTHPPFQHRMPCS